jgi:N-acetylglucosamine kinase-like BadF-type ATPase
VERGQDNVTRYLLGVDVGATKSHALIADEQGHAIGFGEQGPGNYERVGWDGLQRTLQAVTDEALASAGITVAQLAGAGFGIAGYDWPGEREPHLQAIASLGLSASYSLVNDTVVGLVAGTTAGWGVGVVAGTGCNCWGRDPEGNEGRVTGEGRWFAEYGGGGDLVFRAVQAVSLAWSRRGPETCLTEALVSLTGASDVEDLLEGLILHRYHLSSEAAPLVFQVAAEGDEVALEIIRWAGRELASLAIGVIRQLDLQRQPELEVVQIGSLFDGSPLLGEVMLSTIRAVAPGARLVRLTVPPVIGGVLLGMEQAGIDHASRRETLIETTGALWGTGD